MRVLLTLLALVASTTACQPTDESISGYVSPNAFWELKTLNDADVQGGITITFPAKGQLRGKAPCNSYSARQSEPLPWFRVSGIASTRRLCGAIGLERKYLQLLRTVNMAEVLGDVLLLTGPTGKLVFQRVDTP